MDDLLNILAVIGGIIAFLFWIFRPYSFTLISKFFAYLNGKTSRSNISQRFWFSNKHYVVETRYEDQNYGNIKIDYLEINDKISIIKHQLRTKNLDSKMNIYYLQNDIENLITNKRLEITYGFIPKIRRKNNIKRLSKYLVKLENLKHEYFE